MSSDTPDDDRPIAEIAPEGFLDRYGAACYSEALKAAQRRPTTTPKEELPRCPECGTRRVYPKGHKDSQRHRIDSDYYCANRHHFDEPVYPDDTDDAEEEADERREAVEKYRGGDSGPTDEADDTTDRDPFVWVSAEDLAEPPLARQLADADDRTLAALAIYCYRPWAHTDADPSHRDLAEIFPYSRNWIGKQIRAWRDGDHRDLVADPRPRVSLSADAEGVSAE